MRVLAAVLAALLTLLRVADAGTPTWAQLQGIIGVLDTAPEFQDFAAVQGLAKRRAYSFNAVRKVPPYFYANGSGMSVFLDWNDCVSGVYLHPKPGFDPATCFPLPAGAAPTKSAILDSLGLSEADSDDRGGGARGYNSAGHGVVVIFLGEQLQFVCFYPPKKSPRR